MHVGERGKGGADGHLDARRKRRLEQRAHEAQRLRGRLVHLPVPGNERAARHHRSARTATPGRSRPSRNSREAPPPVLMWVIRSARLNFSTAAAESPPPTIVTAVESTMACATARVPPANGGNSNTPIGPFHMTVPASRMTRR